MDGKYEKCKNLAFTESLIVTCRHRCSITLTETVETIIAPNGTKVSIFNEHIVERGCTESVESTDGFTSSTLYYQCDEPACINEILLPDQEPLILIMTTYILTKA